MTSVPTVGGSTCVMTSNSGASSVSLSYSSLGTISAGDVILLFGVNSYNHVFTVPTGFSTTTYGFSVTAIDSNNDAAGLACYKIATGTESGSLSVSWTSSALGGAAMIRLTGVAATSPIRAATNVITGSGTLSYTAMNPTSTGPGATDMVVRCWILGADDYASYFKTGQINSPSGWTVAQSGYTAATTGSSLYNVGLLIAYLQGGTSTPSVTSVGSDSTDSNKYLPCWMVTEYDIVGLPSSSPSLQVVTTASMMRASFY